ncbi:hypothetical protein BKA70DRAFT_1502993 [Coprinopsis sp. MPI-PUGE-AT-0042]|nr:hypothetical protein BKA70DRAFT_1502993 [Coprinopsis sp. MPI-PUGE-AT-0042]
MTARDSEVDLERKKVDAEIAVLEERIRQLKTKRNTLAPIQSLPNELLCRTFLECRGQWMQLDEEGCPTWIAVTHVCQAWRLSALGYPQLWSSVDREIGVYWMETFLSRSKGAPLSLRILEEWDEEYMSVELEILSSILRDHQRLEGVTIEMRGDKLHGLLKNLTERMPNIVRFTLHNHSFDGLDLPSPLFANYAPRLQVLSLYNFDPPWTSPIMEGLASLSILNANDFREVSVPSLKTLFDALSKVPGLQHLALENVLPEPRPKRPTLVIRHIRIPISAKVKLRLFDTDESRLKELFEVLGSALKGEPLLMTESHAGEEQCDSISFSGSSNGISCSIRQSTGPSPFELHATSEKWNPLIHTVPVNAIPLTSLTSLSIIISELKPAILKITLLQLLSVSRLFTSHTPGTIFKALLEDPAVKELGGLSGQPTPTIYLPQLTNLYIAHIRFIHDSDADQEAYGLRLGDLERWLRFRNACGASIQLLEIVHCSDMTAATVNTLQVCMGAGGRVVWDDIGF